MSNTSPSEVEVVEETEEIVDEESTHDLASGEDLASGQDVNEEPEPHQRSKKSIDLVRQGDVAADYLEVLLDIADLDGDIDIDVENDRASLEIVEVESGDLEVLLGNDGEVLSALQDLTRLAVTRETGERSRLMLDIAGYREAQRETLRQIARDAVAEAKESDAPVRMTAMNSFERKVVHDVVADEGLKSDSEGSEPNRYVVVSIGE
jgi:spoIIIJ-associated protein